MLDSRRVPVVTVKAPLAQSIIMAGGFSGGTIPPSVQTAKQAVWSDARRHWLQHEEFIALPSQLGPL
ncbi:hypothetical protein N7474_007375 [Penicillium riverlandense]|uniref:uncharacterized protein n=1 Tax=Penicillium riverlandense TaxID=1903569 RepID=UPI0025487B25|nr:uncharacterized protein N7474_007375 [Penicillium riverlandense]KAJ5815598.1 hypothetical protein N7474_007375 [Penicillium riverlandense]